MKKLVRKCLEEVYKEDVLSNPMTPSKWVSTNPEYIPITRLMLTSGGGLGGKSWYEYVKRVNFEKLVNTNGMVAFETYEGKQKMINTAYIVEAENFQIMHAKLNSSNKNFDTGIYDYYYLLEEGQKVKIVETICRFDNVR